MRIRMLGPLEIHGDADRGRIVVGGLKRPALLATLVVRAGRTVSTDRLIQELWSDDPPANASNALQAHIKRLRRLIGSACGEPDRIVTRSPGYLLSLRPGETDVELFMERLARGRAIAATDPNGAVPILREALALWRGSALDGCVLGDICAAEAAVLEENRLAALEALYDACLRASRHQEIVGELVETAAAYPLRERISDQLMVALYRSDRQSEAIGVYDRVRHRLLAELGVEPGPALRATMQAILSHSPIMLAAPDDKPQTTGDAVGGWWAGKTTGDAVGGWWAGKTLSEELALLQRQINTLAGRQAALLRMVKDG